MADETVKKYKERILKEISGDWGSLTPGKTKIKTIKGKVARKVYAKKVKLAEKRRKQEAKLKPTDLKYGTKFSSKPGQKVKKLYWDPETKKYYPRPKRSENKYRSVDKPKVYATGGIADVKGNGRAQTGGIKKIQLSGKHWNKDIG